MSIKKYTLRNGHRGEDLAEAVEALGRFTCPTRALEGIAEDFIPIVTVDQYEDARRFCSFTVGDLRRAAAIVNRHREVGR